MIFSWGYFWCLKLGVIISIGCLWVFYREHIDDFLKPHSMFDGVWSKCGRVS